MPRLARALAVIAIGFLTSSAAPATGPAPLRVGAVYSSAQLGSQSFIRLANTGSSAGAAQITLYDGASGASLGQWTSPAIPVGAAPQYAISTLESAIGGAPKPQFYGLLISANFTGTFQHVLWRSTDGTLTNLSTCASGTLIAGTQVANVHSSLLQAAYPSSVVIANADPVANAVTIGIYDARDNTKLGVYTNAAIPGNASVVVAIADIEKGAGITPSAGQLHYVLRIEGGFKGYLQHLVNNANSGVITDMTTVCSLDGTGSKLTAQAVRTGAVYGSVQPGSQSYLRFYNTGTTSGTITVILTDATTGQTYSQWTSPAIAPGTSPQFGIGTLESNAELPITKAQFYAIRVKTELPGYFQHILYRPSVNTLTNLSTCDTGVTSNTTTLQNVHSSLLDFGYPSTVVVNNTGASSETVSLGVYDAANGQKLGVFTTPPIAGSAQYMVSVDAIEAALKLKPAGTQFHYVVKAEGAFTGYLQHLVNNVVSGVVTDMTTTCQVPGLPQGSPITITKGGTYSGTWVSLDPKVPAVTITTTDLVTLQNCDIRGRGTLVYVGTTGGNDPLHGKLTIRNCHAVALDPHVAGNHVGMFLVVNDLDSAIIENNLIENAYGGATLNATGTYAQPGPFRVRYNVFNNLDSAPSSGDGGRSLAALLTQPDNQVQPGTQPPPQTWFGLSGAHSISFSSSPLPSGAEVAWNEIINEPGISSPGDSMDVWRAGGTTTAPMLIHDNYIQGGFPYDPHATSYYSGGITMDGSLQDTASTATQFVKIYNNQVVAHANFGVAPGNGHDVEAYGNRVVSAGQFPDGSWYQGYAGVWVERCTCGTPVAAYFNNYAHDNVVGYRFEWTYDHPTFFSGPPARQDYLLTDCAGGASGASSKCTNNVSLPDPITFATEQNEAAIWLQKLAASSITLGLTP